MINTPLKRIALRIPSWYMMQDSILLGIVDYIDTHKCNWLLDIPRGSDGELPEVKIDAEWQGDGILSFRYTAEEVESFRARGISHVNLSSVTLPGVPSAVPDNYAVGQLAAKHLVGLGLTKFAFLGRSGRSYSEERAQGYSDYLSSTGMQVEEYFLGVNDVAVTGRSDYLERQLRGILPRLAKPTGFFVVDDLLAAKVLSVAESLDISVPKDLAVIGFNSKPVFCLSTRPALSSIQYPARQVGYIAASILDRAMSGGEVQEMYKVPVRSIDHRESSNTLAFKDLRLRAAMKFIHEEAPTRALQVNDVCQYLAISKSSLKDIMARELSRSPKSEISNVRIEVFKRHLETSEMSVKEIAYTMGFPAAEEASRFFKRMAGCTPTQYRESLL